MRVNLVGHFARRGIAHLREGDAADVHSGVRTDHAGERRDHVGISLVRDVNDNHGKFVGFDFKTPVEIARLIKVSVLCGRTPGGEAAAGIRHEQRNGVHGLQQSQGNAGTIGEAGHFLLHAIIPKGRRSRPDFAQVVAGDVQFFHNTFHRGGNELFHLRTDDLSQLASHFVRSAFDDNDRHLRGAFLDHQLVAFCQAGFGRLEPGIGLGRFSNGGERRAGKQSDHWMGMFHGVEG